MAPIRTARLQDRAREGDRTLFLAGGVHPAHHAKVCLKHGRTEKRYPLVPDYPMPDLSQVGEAGSLIDKLALAEPLREDWPAGTEVTVEA